MIWRSSHCSPSAAPAAPSRSIWPASCGMPHRLRAAGRPSVFSAPRCGAVAGRLRDIAEPARVGRDTDPARLAEAVARRWSDAPGDALSGEGVPLVELRVAVALKYRSQPHARRRRAAARRLTSWPGSATPSRGSTTSTRGSTACAAPTPVDLVSVSATRPRPATPASGRYRRAPGDDGCTAPCVPPRDWYRDGERPARRARDPARRVAAAASAHAGPCFVEDAFASIAVPPGATATVDALGGVTLEVLDGS